MVSEPDGNFWAIIEDICDRAAATREASDPDEKSVTVQISKSDLAVLRAAYGG